MKKLSFKKTSHRRFKVAGELPPDEGPLVDKIWEKYNVEELIESMVEMSGVLDLDEVDSDEAIDTIANFANSVVLELRERMVLPMSEEFEIEMDEKVTDYIMDTYLTHINPGDFRL